MSKRILVVDDQPDNRQIIRDMLASTDYEITEAEDGASRRLLVKAVPWVATSWSNQPKCCGLPGMFEQLGRII
jgi:CheY-like chemotaxis protein